MYKSKKEECENLTFLHLLQILNMPWLSFARLARCSAPFQSVLFENFPQFVFAGRPQTIANAGMSIGKVGLGVRHERLLCGCVEDEKSHGNPHVWQFVHRLQVTRQVNLVLKEAPWCSSVKDGLERLNVAYNDGIVAQVLRSDISIDSALCFFKWLSNQRSFAHNLCTFGVMIDRLREAGLMDEMLMLIKEAHRSDFEKTLFNFNRLLKWYGRAQNVEGAIDVWREMEAAKIKPKVGGYNTMIEVYVQTKRIREAVMLHSRMMEEGCVPNLRTYTIFIRHLTETGKPDVAYVVFRKLSQLKIRPTAALYLMLMSAYAAAGKTALVQTLGREMRDNCNCPRPVILSKLRALAKANKLKEVELVASEVLPDLHVASGSSKLSELISRSDSFDEGDVLRAEDSAEDESEDSDESERASGFTVDYDPCLNPNELVIALKKWTLDTATALESTKVVWTSRLVFDILRRTRKAGAAWKFFCWVQEQPGFMHNSLTTSKMISLLSIDRYIYSLDELLDKAEREKLQLSVIALNSAIRTYGISKKADRAISLFERMKAFGVEPNKESYRSIIHALVRHKRCLKAKELFEQMQRSGLQPTLPIFLSLIECFGMAGMTSIADSLFEQIVETGLKPDADVYTAIIKSQFWAGRPIVAMKLFEQSQDSGLKPTRNLIETMVKGLRSMSLQRQANDLQEIFLQLLPLRQRNGCALEEAKQVQKFLQKSLTEMDAFQYV
eukprot:c53352_g1_i1 orf=95-2269(+)